MTKRWTDYCEAVVEQLTLPDVQLNILIFTRQKVDAYKDHFIYGHKLYICDSYSGTIKGMYENGKHHAGVQEPMFYNIIIDDLDDVYIDCFESFIKLVPCALCNGGMYIINNWSSPPKLSYRMALKRTIYFMRKFGKEHTLNNSRRGVIESITDLFSNRHSDNKEKVAESFKFGGGLLILPHTAIFLYDLS